MGSVSNETGYEGVLVDENQQFILDGEWSSRTKQKGIDWVNLYGLEVDDWRTVVTIYV